MSVAPITEADIPVEFGAPYGFGFAAAFELNVGLDPLGVPAQLSIPVPPTLTPGTAVYFFRAAYLPDETGGEFPVWMQEELGVVGEDGFARDNFTAV